MSKNRFPDPSVLLPTQGDVHLAGAGRRGVPQRSGVDVPAAQPAAAGPLFMAGPPPPGKLCPREWGSGSIAALHILGRGPKLVIFQEDSPGSDPAGPTAPPPQGVTVGGNKHTFFVCFDIFSPGFACLFCIFFYFFCVSSPVIFRFLIGKVFDKKKSARWTRFLTECFCHV